MNVNFDCNLCGCKEGKTIPFRYAFKDKFLWGVKCNNCELVSIWPRPTDDEIVEMYASDYFTGNDKETHHMEVAYVDLLASGDYADGITHIQQYCKIGNILDIVEKYNNDIQNASINNDMEQEDNNTVLNDLLDKYEIIAPYRIENRSELEETPIERDYSVDNVMENYVIQGTLNGEVKEIEPFDSKEVADSLLDDYKKIYTEYENLEVVSKKNNE